MNNTANGRSSVGRARVVFRRVLAEAAACEGAKRARRETALARGVEAGEARSGSRAEERRSLGGNPEVTVRGVKESRRCAAEATVARQGGGVAGCPRREGSAARSRCGGRSVSPERSGEIHQ